MRNVEQSPLPKDIYFLGAGSSSLVGVPTFEYFNNKAREICSNLPKGDEKTLFERVLKHWDDKFKGLNIEHYFTAIEIEKNLNKVLNGDGNRENNEIKSEDIMKFISYTIERSSKNKLPRDKISKFLEGIFSNKRISRSAIISTNWDILLETSSSHLSLKNKYIKYDEIRPYSESEGEKIERESQLSILKLHGSINWGYCRGCNEIYYFNTERMPDDKECPIPKKECQQKKLELALIPPRCSKLEGLPSLGKIWKKAQDYLESCEKIFFIGYSFPESDLQMRIFISNALKNNKNLKEVNVISNEKDVISKIDFEKRYLSILPANSKIKFHYDGFEKIHEKLPEYLRQTEGFKGW